MIDTPTITQAPEVLTAEIELVIPRDRIMQEMGPAIREIYSAVMSQGCKPTGQWFTHHKQRPTDVFDFKACVPVSTPVAPTGRVTPGRREAARVARTIYTGSYEGLGAAWGEFCAWVAANGHTPRADLWESYLVGPETTPNPAEWKTELNQPLV